MFSYYGSKFKIAKLYPKPKYNIIIEPFAGAACYSLLYKYKNVILNEKYDRLYRLWNWLIHESTEEEIKNNSNFYLNEDISKLNLKQEHKDLIGFCINRGCSSPANIVQKWSCQVKTQPNWASTASYRLKEISKEINHIKHWKILHGDYKQLENIEATWFIDPPYQNGGKYYHENKINYEELAEWCQTRKGQIIVCENSQASWLPFKELIQITGQRKKTTEVTWTNDL